MRIKCAFVLIISILIVNLISSQWQKRNDCGPSSPQLVWRMDSIYFMSQDYTNQWYRSKDNGISWTRMAFQYTDYGTAFGNYGTTIYAFDKSKGLSVSNDLGDTWQLLSNDAINYQYPRKIVVTDNYVFYSDEKTVHRYDKKFPLSETKVFSCTLHNFNYYLQMESRNNDLWIAVNDSVLYSADNGLTWVKKFTTTETRALALHGDTILLATYNAMYRSVDYGTTWAKLALSYSVGIYLKYEDGWWINDGGNGNTIYSTDAGVTWKIINPFLIGSNDYAQVFKYNSNLIIRLGALLFSTDEGKTLAIKDGFKDQNSSSFDGIDLNSDGNILFFGRSISDDHGKSWYSPLLPKFFTLSNYFYFHGQFFGYNNQEKTLYKSDDIHTWTAVSGPFTDNNQLFFTNDNFIFRLNLNQTTKKIELYKSENQGADWILMNSFDQYYFYTFCGYKQRIYEMGQTGLQYSEDDGITWKPTGAGLSVFTQGIFSPQMKAKNNVLAMYSDEYIAISTNDGLTFDLISNTLKPTSGTGPVFVKDLEITGDFIAVISDDESPSHYLYSITNKSWVDITYNFSTTQYAYGSIASINNVLYCNAESGDNNFWSYDLGNVKFNNLSGIVYHDLNNNGIQDTLELAYSGALLKAGTGSFTTSAKDGKYNFDAFLDQDTIRIINSNSWIHSNPPYYIVTGAAQDLNFGLYRTPGIVDDQVSLTSNARFRPGFNSLLTAYIRNRGSVTSSGTFTIYLSSPLQYYSSSQAELLITADSVSWRYDNLEPDQEMYIIISVKTLAVATIGNAVNIRCKLYPDGKDQDLTNNEDEIADIVVGSFDPNDKECNLKDNYSPDKLATRDPLTYTIRFQNQGNAAAEFITVLDTLSSFLDPSTFEFLGSSHPCDISITGKGIIRFYFENINLPPKDPYEILSHGFVKYRIKPFANLNLNDNIENKASIYFDFNTPVVTNTVKNTIAFPVGTQNYKNTKTSTLIILPNPVNDLFTIESTNRTGGIIQFLTLDGKLYKELKTNQHQLTLSSANFQHGMYWVKWIHQDGKIGLGNFIVE